MKEKITFTKDTWARSLFLIINAILMVMIFVAVLLPIVKVLSDSFEGRYTYSFKLWPNQFSTDAYRRVFTRADLYKPFMISTYITVVGTMISMALTTLAGYVLIQESLPGRKFLNWFIMITMVFNAGLIPTYLTMRDLHLIDTLWAVILPIATSTYNIILMRNFFETVPASLAESADIDGCTPFQIFYKIMLPLSKPALATVGLFTIVNYWNEYFSLIIYINKVELYNFQIILRKFVISGDNIPTSDVYVFPEALKNAIIIISMLPIMVIYPFLQKYFVQGVNLGAVKE